MEQANARETVRAVATYLGEVAGSRCPLTCRRNWPAPPRCGGKRHAARLQPRRRPSGLPGASGDQGLPLQDVGRALGVSFQRAKQLIDEAGKRAS
jgi:hypothetical protein